MQAMHTPGSLSRFRKTLESFTPFSDDDFAAIAGMMHEKQFDKGEVLIREGQVCKEFYYILTGCLRSFSLEEGREVNVKFFFEDEFACDFESMRHETISQFYLVAMEDVTVFYATKTEAVPVMENFNTFLFRFFQEQYFNESEHSNTFKLLSPEERYTYLLTQRPHYLQRIPLTHLATYLGMSRETLTRIRKKIM
jgi:CRP-like cAMP-binding protein